MPPWHVHSKAMACGRMACHNMTAVWQVEELDANEVDAVEREIQQVWKCAKEEAVAIRILGAQGANASYINGVYDLIKKKAYH